jgi:hypothetical protein
MKVLVRYQISCISLHNFFPSRQSRRTSMLQDYVISKSHSAPDYSNLLSKSDYLQLLRQWERAGCALWYPEI